MSIAKAFTLSFKRSVHSKMDSTPNYSQVKTYQITRGNLASHDSTNLKNMQQLLLEGKKKEVLNAIKSARLSWNYSGALYTVCFQVNKSIILTDVGFWGPFLTTDAGYMYKVKVMVSQATILNDPTDNVDKEVVLSKLDTFVQPSHKELFFVSLPDEPKIVPHRWTRIRFQLDGPDTCICSSVTSTIRCENSGVDFEFLESSNQMPVIRFQV